MEKEQVYIRERIYLVREEKEIDLNKKEQWECKLRSNGMPVPLLRNCYSIFNGTKYR